MNKLYTLILIFGLILVSGCTQKEEITCNPPYIKVGTECCLDVNSNNICDSDEKPTTTETITTTTSQRVGNLDVKKEFFVECKKSSKNQGWCSIQTDGNKNEVTINTSSLGAQENNFAEIATWIYNRGSSDIINISYDISCDQIYPTNESRVITKDGDKYKTVIPTIYFRCVGCSLGCDCTPERYGKVINKLKAGDETTFRIELLGVNNFPEKADLSCKLNIYSKQPDIKHTFDLIIHFNV